jgi:hypothetical protein
MALRREDGLTRSTPLLATAAPSSRPNPFPKAEEIAAQPLAIDQRLAAEAALSAGEFEVLARYAVASIAAVQNDSVLTQRQLVCDGTGVLETAGAYGRASAEDRAIARAERERVVAALVGVLGADTAERVVQFALSVTGPTIRTIDVAATVSQLAPQEIAAAYGFLCTSRPPPAEK